MSNVTHAKPVIAGVSQARCTCCEHEQALVPHVRLDASRLACPETRATYLDRGDGMYEADGGSLEGQGPLEPRAEASPSSPTVPDILSDRPQRTGPKTRIDLERATFAS